MTVGELIELLQCHDPDLPVIVRWQHLAVPCAGVDAGRYTPAPAAAGRADSFERCPDADVNAIALSLPDQSVGLRSREPNT